MSNSLEVAYLLLWMDEHGFDQKSKLHLLEVTKGNAELMRKSLATAGL